MSEPTTENVSNTENISTEAVSVTQDLSLVYDVPVTLKVLLGETALTIGEILKCGKGSVIPLNQKVGDPFLVILQKKAIAEGEIVQAGENFGIKITNILKD
jgi:flagellar motor switch protein FliN/FliY